MAEYSMEPIEVSQVETKHRTIKTKIPVPESLPLLEGLLKAEPRSMLGQPPIIWDKAEGFTVTDKWGNRWIDWTSGVMITNIGHGHPAIKQAIKEVLDKTLLTTYVFPHAARLNLVKELQKLAPVPQDYRVFLLSTGSEATENCIKLSKTYALKKYGPQKRYIVSFENAFHGRTMGAQLAGGMPGQKDWLGESDKSFTQVPFPDGFYNENISFDLFLQTLEKKKVPANEIAGVITESFQGVGPYFFPGEYIKKLEAFCREYDIVFTLDEVQGGFGRTGKLFNFQHYDITPDLIACGKGISSSLPISAVIGRKEIMGLYPPGSMTSTHSGSPICAAAAYANIKELLRGDYIENAAKLECLFLERLTAIHKKHPEVCASVKGKGLVAGLLIVKPGTKTPDSETAVRINLGCFQRGVLMYAPVGIGGECIKICPPLCITEEAAKESLDILAEVVDECLG